MLHQLAKTAAGLDKDIWWRHGARNGREHAFAKETQDIPGDLRHGHSFIIYSAPDDRDRLSSDFDSQGHLKQLVGLES